MADLNLFNLEGKVAVVTGASYGIGKGIAEGLAEAGADVVPASRSLDNLKEVAENIEKIGRKSLPIACDVADTAQIKDMFARVHSEFGRVDISVNAAGITRRSPAIEFPEEDWDDVISVNLKGLFICCQEAGKIMIEQGGGKIINIASMMTFFGGILVPAYSASKGGVGQLTKALSNEWAKHNVNVNAIAPGYILTPMTAAIQKDPVRFPAITARIPSGRWGEPEDMKGAAIFLASPASDYIHGHILAVDGGYAGW